MKIIGDLLKISGLFLLGLTMGTLFGVFTLGLIFELDVMKMLSNAQEFANFFNPVSLQLHPQGKAILLYLQACTAVGGFLVSTWIFLYFFEEKGFGYFKNNSPKFFISLLPVFALVIVVMPFTSWVVAWNNEIKFPEPFHTWALESESQAQVLTLFLTNFSNIWEFLLGVLVIGVLPAVGEEWLFRGILQPKLQESFSPSPYAHHIAIWVSAITFSAIHFQFFGFVPRMLLGAMFGYLYVWTQDIRVAIWGHFLNNSLTLLMVYLYKNKVIELDVIKQESPDITMVLASFGLTVVILYFLYQNREKEKSFL